MPQKHGVYTSSLMRFPYQRLLVKDPHQRVRIAYRPLIPVEISLGNKVVLSHALIDSGADVCLFEADLCRRLGLELRQGERHSLQGVGRGKVVFYLHVVHLKVGSNRAKVEIGFCDKMERIPFSILGQKGFFENFLVAFNYPKKWIEVVKAVKR